MHISRLMVIAVLFSALATCDDETSFRRTLSERKMDPRARRENNDVIGSSYLAKHYDSGFIKDCMEVKGFRYVFGLNRCPAETYDQAFMQECYRRDDTVAFSIGAATSAVVSNLAGSWSRSWPRSGFTFDEDVFPSLTT